MIINHNMQAMNTQRQLGTVNSAQSKSMEKLSSGYRINRAGDDAAGLAISEKMRAQIAGLDQASRNAQDGISMIQTAEGALNETQSILQRMRELSVQSANDTNETEDREALQNEIDQLASEIDRIANTTEFNKKTLLNGDLASVKTEVGNVQYESGNSDVFTAIGETTVSSLTTAGSAGDESVNVSISDYDASSDVYTLTWTTDDGDTGTATVGAAGGTVSIDTTGGATTGTAANGGDYTVTVGAVTTDDIGEEFTFTSRSNDVSYGDNSVNFQIGANSSQVMSVGIEDMRAAALNVDDIDITTAGSAEASISAINQAIEDVSAQRSSLGAYQNRLEHTIANLDTSQENLQASESRIRDVDMAAEMMEYSKNNILSQAANSMLAQANQAPQSVLQLLG